MRQARKTSLWGELLLWTVFLGVSGVNVLLLGIFDSWRQSRVGRVSDGGMQFLDLMGIALLGLTLLGLRVGSRRNVGITSVIICAVLPGIALIIYELTF